jgi:hypothetical protein
VGGFYYKVVNRRGNGDYAAEAPKCKRRIIVSLVQNLVSVRKRHFSFSASISDLAMLHYPNHPATGSARSALNLVAQECSIAQE